MTTVVTGGSGFVGTSVLANLLSRGEKAVSADVRPLGGEQLWLLHSDAERVEHVACDVTKLSSVIEALRSTDVQRVIHTAGVIWGDHRMMLDINLQGTLNVLEACRLLGVEKVVVMSSFGVLAPAQYEPLDTRHPLLLPDAPPFNGIYSASKIAGEALSWAYTTTFGMDVTVVRPCSVYGFGEAPAMRIRPMIENALAGVPSRFAEGRGVRRSYTHVADVAEVSVLAAFRDTPVGGDRIFFAGTDSPTVSQGEIADIITELVPGAVIEIGEDLTPANVREGLYRRAFDITSTREQLGFEPLFPTMREGLAEAVERYRAYAQA